MSNLDHNTYRAGTTATRAGEIDAGLRSYMLGIYNYMAVALAVTGAAAFAVAELEPLRQIFFKTALTETGQSVITYTMAGWIAAFAPLGFYFLVFPRMNRMSVSGMQTAFWAFALVFGISLSSILLIYTAESIARVFFITAASFAGLSLWGYTTKKDLSGWGSFLRMGAIGLVIAIVVNIFLGSSTLQFVISIVGVGIFSGLTAHDTQDLKNIYLGGIEQHGREAVQKSSVFGALRLYIDFIGIFIFLMHLLGNRE